MASVFNTGSKASPEFHVRWKDYDPATGDRWRTRRVRLAKKKDAQAHARALEAEAEKVRLGLALHPTVAAKQATTMAQLFETWTMQLTNRSFRNDVSRTRVHLLPYWGAVRVADVNVGRVLAWLKSMRDGELAPGTQRGLLGLLSRAMAYAVGEGLAATNCVRDVPAGARPVGAAPSDVTWIADDETPGDIMAALPEAFSLAWYVCFSTGCRMGEAFGLRLGDLADAEIGSIRLAHSWDGPLKEFKPGKKSEKFVPCPADLMTRLGPWLERRRAEGATDDDRVFPNVVAFQVHYQWGKACAALGLDGLTWHHATRTTFASRAAARGVPLDAIAGALGHASTAMVQRTYQRFVRRTFDARLTMGLAPMPTTGKVLPIGAPRANPAPTVAVNNPMQITA